MAATLEILKKELSEAKTQLKEVNGFKPVIFKSEYKKNKFNFGVQFWSEFSIKAGKSRNSDGTLAVFVELV